MKFSSIYDAYNKYITLISRMEEMYAILNIKKEFKQANVRTSLQIFLVKNRLAVVFMITNKSDCGGSFFFFVCIYIYSVQ